MSEKYYKPTEALPVEGNLIKILFYYSDPKELYTTVGFLVKTYANIYFKEHDGGKISLDRVHSWAYIPIVPPEG